MVPKSMRVSGKRIYFEWHPDVTGDGGLVDCLPGVMSFHAESFDDARQTIRSLFTPADTDDPETIRRQREGRAQANAPGR